MFLYCNIFGVIAQLVECLHGMQDVSGSSPLNSKKLILIGMMKIKLKNTQNNMKYYY